MRALCTLASVLFLATSRALSLLSGVPILLGFLDYSKKEAGVGPVFWPTGDYEKDLEEIKAFYRTKKGRFPAQGVR